MAISAVNKKSTGGKAGGGHPMLSGILIGLVLGVGLSAAVAVWVSRMPSPFQNRALEGAGQPPAVIPPTAPAPPPGGSARPADQAGGTTAPAAGSSAAGAGPGGGQVPANPGGGDAVPGSAGTASAGSTGKPLDSGTATLQVGAFSSEEDAMRQVETIAQVSGAQAQVIPPSGEQNLFRVRIGPVQRGAELTELVDALKANGISSTVVRTPAAPARTNP